MNKNKAFKILRQISKIVCMQMCPKDLSDCNTDECEFQKLLIEIVKEVSR